MLITPHALYFKSKLIVLITIIIVIVIIKKIQKKGISQIKDEKKFFGELEIPKKRALPPRIPNFKDEFANAELLNLSLERDIAQILLSAVENNVLDEEFPSICIKELKSIGLWRAFSKETSYHETVK